MASKKERQELKQLEYLKKQRKEILEEFEKYSSHYSIQWLNEKLTLIDKEIKKIEPQWVTLFTGDFVKGKSFGY